MNPKVKICGLRSVDDLKIAAQSGADWLGLIIGTTHFSEDEISVNQAQSLIDQVEMKPKQQIVLVTHFEDAEMISETAKQINADIIQAHGLMDLDQVKKLRQITDRTIVRVVHINFNNPEKSIQEEIDFVDGFVFDTATPDRLGGTGLTHDWSVSAALARRLQAENKLAVLAGGLNPANLEKAIALVQPDLVDVNSGVENQEGNKDPDQVEQFVSIAQGFQA
jgi:phosphoribosylanthranilate isomerase